MEEPESHLHPRAIHELKAVLEELAGVNQVVLTTHNPLFVNRSAISSNIIVNQNRAFAAKDITEIRSVLGVEVADNLRGAELVLIVEGDEDAIALRGILSHKSELLREALTSNRLSMDSLGGAGNLRYKVGLHRSNLCRVYAFLDYDKAGKNAYEKCEKDNSLVIADVNFARCPGLEESELEDLYDEGVVNQFLAGDGIDLANCRTPKKKWSDRVRSACQVSGKPLTDLTLMQMKRAIAIHVAKIGYSSLHEKKRGPIEALVEALVRRLAGQT